MSQTSGEWPGWILFTPAISIAYGIAGIIGPIVGGAIKDISGSYYTAIIIGAIVCVSGIGAYALLMPHKAHFKADAGVKEGTPLVASKSGP